MSLDTALRPLFSFPLLLGPGLHLLWSLAQTDYQQEVRIIPLAFMGGVCIPNAHLLLHTTIVQHVPYFFLSVSWCGNPQEGLLCQMLQLFGMIFWTCEKPKSVKDWFYTGQMNWRHICNCHGPVVLKNKHISHNEMYLKIIFLPNTLGCYCPLLCLKTITELQKKKKILYKYNLLSIGMDCMTLSQGTVDQKLSLACSPFFAIYMSSLKQI